MTFVSDSARHLPEVSDQQILEKVRENPHNCKGVDCVRNLCQALLGRLVNPAELPKLILRIESLQDGVERLQLRRQSGRIVEIKHIRGGVRGATSKRPSGNKPSGTKPQQPTPAPAAARPVERRPTPYVSLRIMLRDAGLGHLVPSQFEPDEPPAQRRFDPDPESHRPTGKDEDPFRGFRGESLARLMENNGR